MQKIYDSQNITLNDRLNKAAKMANTRVSGCGWFSSRGPFLEERLRIDMVPWKFRILSATDNRRNYWHLYVIVHRRQKAIKFPCQFSWSIVASEGPLAMNQLLRIASELHPGVGMMAELCKWPPGKLVVHVGKKILPLLLGWALLHSWNTTPPPTPSLSPTTKPTLHEARPLLVTMYGYPAFWNYSSLWEYSHVSFGKCPIDMCDPCNSHDVKGGRYSMLKLWKLRAFQRTFLLVTLGIESARLWRRYWKSTICSIHCWLPLSM